MPHDIEEVLAAAKLTLLPSSYDELRAGCTCPDAANPCKHTAAVYYVLAERFDGDPFALFTLRGRTGEELLDSLRARRAKAAGTRPPAATPALAEPPPLSAVLDSFWRAGSELDELRVSPLASEAPDALLRRLGPAGGGRRRPRPRRAARPGLRAARRGRRAPRARGMRPSLARSGPDGRATTLKPCPSARCGC